MQLADLLETCGPLSDRAAVGAISRAYHLARRAHAGQTRSDGRPVWRHVLGVVEVLVGEVGECSPDAVAAALLHDVIEVGGPGREEIAALFGPQVARLVAALTKPERGADSGGADYVWQVAAAGPVAVRIKLCDRIDGLRSVAGRPVGARARFLVQTREQYLPLAREHAPELLELLERELARALRTA